MKMFLNNNNNNIKDNIKATAISTTETNFKI